MFGMDQEDASVSAATKRAELGLVRDSRTHARDARDKRDEKSSPSPGSKRYQQRKRKRREERQERFYPVLKESSSSMVMLVMILTWVWVVNVMLCLALLASQQTEDKVQLQPSSRRPCRLGHVQHGHAPFSVPRLFHLGLLFQPKWRWDGVLLSHGSLLPQLPPSFSLPAQVQRFSAAAVSEVQTKLSQR